MIKWKKVIQLIVITVTAFQLIYYCILKNDNVENDITNIKSNDNPQVNIKDIDSDLNKIKSLKINNQSKDEGKWKSDISISGNKDEIINALNKLTEYKIIKYSIDGKEHIYNVKMEIIR